MKENHLRLCWYSIEDLEGEPSPPMWGQSHSDVKIDSKNIRHTQRIGTDQRILEFGFHNCAVHSAFDHLRHHLSVFIIVMVIIIIIHDANELF